MAMIGIDARKYFDYGIGTYLQNLLGEFSRNGGGHSFTLFVSPEEESAVRKRGSWEIIPAPWKKYSAGELLFLGKMADRARAAVLHVPHYTLPFGFPRATVVTIHDLIHLRFPRGFSLAQRAYALLVMGHAVRSADAVITVSEYTRSDILSQFSLSSEKVHVIPLAAHEGFGRVPANRVEDFRSQYGLRNPFILYAGGLGYHKDIPTLVGSFDLLAARIKECDLVLAGAPAERAQGAVSGSRFVQRIKCIEIGRAHV